MKILCIVFVGLFTLPIRGVSEVIVRGSVEMGSATLTYYRPFKGYANNFIESSYDFGGSKNFQLNFQISEPTFIRFIFGGRAIILFCNVNDIFDLRINTASQSNWLSITGSNTPGQIHYNLHYNANSFTKFSAIREVFELHHAKEPGHMVAELEKSISRQMVWVDSLYNLKQITFEYADRMKLQIRAILIWEISNQCDKYFDASSQGAKANLILKQFFDQIDPEDPRLKQCLSVSSYFDVYCRFLKNAGAKIDSSKVISPDVPYYALAPQSVQDFLWGFAIHATWTYAPLNFDCCKMYDQYKRTFALGVFLDHLEQLRMCDPKATTESKILPVFDGDLFFVLSNFKGKRVFVDIWATWCAPCKAEFAYYTNNFYQFMKNHQVELVYISIDRPQQKERWKDEVTRLGLKGSHILAGPALQASLKDVVFEGGPFIIPRYLLIDENGQILSADFSRPSDPQIWNAVEKEFDR